MSIHLLMSKRARKTVIQKLRFKHLFEKYVTYMEETTDTSNGKTTQCWINYAYLALIVQGKWMIHSFLHPCFIRLVQFSSFESSSKLFPLDDNRSVGIDEFAWRKSPFDRGFSVNRTENSFLCDSTRYESCTNN